ncbi:hypothetical protein RHECNPAF_470032 [Rhizobium etli CNPAF512]|nr:hypothetical protein RHECNPAF_470032 [Rhizobium etli CNPAF512]
MLNPNASNRHDNRLVEVGEIPPRTGCWRRSPVLAVDDNLLLDFVAELFVFADQPFFPRALVSKPLQRIDCEIVGLEHLLECLTGYTRQQMPDIGKSQH